MIAGTNSLLGDIFGIGTPSHTGYIPPKQTWLSAQTGKGLEITGTWSRYCLAASTGTTVVASDGKNYTDPDPQHRLWPTSSNSYVNNVYSR